MLILEYIINVFKYLPLVYLLKLRRMDICNIKCHCEIKKKFLNEFIISFKHKGYKQFPSFEVFKVGDYSFVCYYSGYVNITGLKKVNEIEIALFTLKKLLRNTFLEFENVVIDNITAKCCCIVPRQICLQRKREKIESELKDKIKSIKYEREIFPNMFIKTKYSTLIWSSNNKVSCVGLKNIVHIKKLCKLIKKIEAI